MLIIETNLSAAGFKLDYRLRQRPGTKRLKLTVQPGGQIIVSAPPRFSRRLIEQFIRQHRAWLEKQIERSKLLPTTTTNRRAYLKNKSAARQLAMERLAFFNQHYNFSYQRLTIRNQRTRWGSCSKQGALSFNYKISLLPPDLADYVIVHELCHLGQFNHSAKFWALVGQTIPDYLARRRALRRLGLSGFDLNSGDDLC